VIQGVFASTPMHITTSASQAQTRLHHHQRQRQRLHQQTRHRHQHRVVHALAVTAQFGVEILVSLLTARAFAIKTLEAPILTYQPGVVLRHLVGGVAQNHVRQGSINFLTVKVGRFPLTKFMQREEVRTEHLHTSSFAMACRTGIVGLGRTL